jgi:hypothetical protein
MKASTVSAASPLRYSTVIVPVIVDPQMSAGLTTRLYNVMSDRRGGGSVDPPCILKTYH